MVALTLAKSRKRNFCTQYVGERLVGLLIIRYGNSIYQTDVVLTVVRINWPILLLGPIHDGRILVYYVHYESFRIHANRSLQCDWGGGYECYTFDFWSGTSAIAELPDIATFSYHIA